MSTIAFDENSRQNSQPSVNSIDVTASARAFATRARGETCKSVEGDVYVAHTVARAG